MASPRKIMTMAFGWLVTITLSHLWLNTDFFTAVRDDHQQSSQRMRLGYLPVTCHLTCPVTHFINEQSSGDGGFDPVRFGGWPELKEAFLSGHLQAAFMLAPMAIALREQGVPIKIVYLGHRDGTTMMVRKDSAIHSIEDLRGKRVAIPNRFSNQWLVVFRTLTQRGIPVQAVRLLELPPPDMPAALESGAVDAIISGEPFMAQSEMSGTGRVLFMSKDVWPGFISCVLVVSEETIRERRADVTRLVEGIAASGEWLDQTPENRVMAAEFAATRYYHQDPKLLEFVLRKPPDRVRYTNLSLRRPDFEEIESLGKAAGILKGSARFVDYADDSFVPENAVVRPHAWQGTR